MPAAAELAVAALAGLGMGALVHALSERAQAQRAGRRQALLWTWLSRQQIPAALLLAGLFVGVRFLPSFTAAPVAQQLIWLAQFCLFALIALVDARSKQVARAPLRLCAALALLDSILLPAHGPGLASALTGAAVGWLLFRLVYLGGRAYSRRIGQPGVLAFGHGDVELLALGGLVLGFPAVLPAALAAILLAGCGAAWTALRLHVRGQSRRLATFAYGPYILCAVLLFMTWIDAG